MAAAGRFALQARRTMARKSPWSCRTREALKELCHKKVSIVLHRRHAMGIKFTSCMLALLCVPGVFLQWSTLLAIQRAKASVGVNASQPILAGSPVLYGRSSPAVETATLFSVFGDGTSMALVSVSARV